MKTFLIVGAILVALVLLSLNGKETKKPYVYPDHLPLNEEDCGNNPFCIDAVITEKRKAYEYSINSSNQEEDYNENSFYQNIVR